LLAPSTKGRATISLDDGASVGDLLTQLRINRRVIVAVNDQRNRSKAQLLQDGDRVAIYTMIGGG